MIIEPVSDHPHVALLPRLELLPSKATTQPVTPDDHSKVVPLLPIPNRTVKRLCADDSGRTSVKVGHRQAFIPQNPIGSRLWGFVFVATKTWRQKAWSESLSRGATNTTIQKSPWAAAPPRGFCLGIKHGIRRARCCELAGTLV